MIKGGATLNDIPVNQFVGQGVYVKVDKDFSLDRLEAANIQPGDIVLFHTGFSDHYHEPAYFEEYPAMGQDVADYLVSKRVKLVGVDTCSPDHDEFVAHRTLLGGNVLIVENLTNLADLANQKFTVYALPIKLELDGAPARVIAVID
jgi:kynurenine formamidase